MSRGIGSVAAGLALAAAAASGLCQDRIAVSTASPEARQYFEQGVVLAWGFNFGEAVRAFREATRRDNECALCYWGIAYALGPSINHDIGERQAAAAYRAAARAKSLAASATAMERALIAAMTKRYARSPHGGHVVRERAYADAMRALTREHAENADVLALAAEAAMNLHPRDYWQSDGAAQSWTPQILAWLERALALAPGHPGANHYLIHALEDSPEPQRALPAAEWLAQLVPQTGHLIHMPAHIYLRLGRYHEARLANERAIAADDAYLRGARSDAAYIEGYARHNVHFLWSSALMEGASAVAAEAAARLAHSVDATSLGGPRGDSAQLYLALPLYTQLRFGQWDVIRAAARPPAAAPYTRGAWRFARGVAAARGGDALAARAELRSLKAIRLESAPARAAELGVASELLQAEIAALEGELGAAIDHAAAAVAAVDRLERHEPPTEIVFSARHRLGALLAAAGRFAEAETVYRADLARLPENGYALAGLANAVRAQGRIAEAAEINSRLERAWAHAEVAIARLPF